MENTFLSKLAGQPPLTTDPLVHKIYSLLEENIISMTLPPESKLVEDDVARSLGVSRSPVREALMRLENSGLVVRTGSKGRIVASFNEQDVVENYEVWAMIESFAGGIACLNAQADDFRKVKEVLDRMKACDEGEFRVYRELNYSFHFNMVAACTNKALVRMYQNALKPIKWCWNLSILWRHDLSHSFSEHEQIFEFYRQRDRAQFETSVRKHIHDASERFRREYARRRVDGEKAFSIKK